MRKMLTPKRKELKTEERAEEDNTVKVESEE